jgi:hypothetical protein
MIDKKRLVKATLSAEAFWSVNKALARKIGIEEAALTAEIIFKHTYWEEKGELDDQGGFFMISEDIQAVMGIGIKPVARLTKSILTQGVVKIKKRGVPAKNYWYPQWDFLFEVLGSEPQKGLSSTTQKGGAAESRKGVAITKNLNQEVNTNKDAAQGRAASPLVNDILKIIYEGTDNKQSLFSDHRIRKLVEKAIESDGIDTLKASLTEYLAEPWMKEKRAYNFTKFFNEKATRERYKPRAVVKVSQSVEVHWLDSTEFTDEQKTDILVKGILDGNLLPKRWIEWEDKICSRLTAEGYSTSEILTAYRKKEASASHAKTQSVRMAS